MGYYSVEGLVFSVWCERSLPSPRGGQIAQRAQFRGMAVAIGALQPDELSTWITHRDLVAGVLGASFMPDATLTHDHFYERARAQLTREARSRP